MSLLPQRKKSVEEIAQLRETFGIPVDSSASQEVVDKIVPTTHQAELEHPAEPVKITPPPEEQHPYEAHAPHSFKHSERITATPESEPEWVAEVSDPPPTTQSPRRVRSLRKSEQAPIPLPKPLVSGDSLLPFHRHSDKELAELRRRETLSLLKPVAVPNLTLAHPVLLVPGYLASIVAVVGFLYYDDYEFQMAITAGCLALALLLAMIIFIRNPYSRHHSAFIAITAIFVSVFALLHYFPQLKFQHGP